MTPEQFIINNQIDDWFKHPTTKRILSLLVERESEAFNAAMNASSKTEVTEIEIRGYLQIAKTTKTIHEILSNKEFLINKLQQ